MWGCTKRRREAEDVVIHILHRRAVGGPTFPECVGSPNRFTLIRNPEMAFTVNPQTFRSRR